MRQAEPKRLAELVLPELAKRVPNGPAPETEQRLISGIAGLTERSKTILELAENSEFYALQRPIPINEKARKLLDGEARRVVESLRSALAQISDWTQGVIEETVRRVAADLNVKLGSVAQPLRAALTGSDKSPGIFEVVEVLGRNETLGRIDDVLAAS
jgi:glutamyl-tRNA synthetase